jgi:hypothetical protein
VPGGPRNNASSWRAIKAPVDRSKIRLRFLLIEVEVEVVEGLLGVAELGLLCPPLQQALAAACEFVGDQAGEQVDGGERFGLGLAQTGFQHGGHSAQAKLFERAVEFDRIHSSISLVL